MNNVESKDSEKYFAEGRSWESNKVLRSEASERKAWWVASGASTITLATVVAFCFLLPLKTVEPFVVRVDNSTGVVDVVNTLKDSKNNYEEVVNKYWLNQYLRYRVGYSRQLADEYYYNVGIMSSGAEQLKYYEEFKPANPESPLNVYGDTAKVYLQTKSISFIKPNVGLVRYVKFIERGGDRPQITHWAATITFKYSGAPMKEKDRLINPLGFQEIEYRNDPETVSPNATAIVAPLVDATKSPVLDASRPVAPIVPAILPAQ